LREKFTTENTEHTEKPKKQSFFSVLSAASVAQIFVSWGIARLCNPPAVYAKMLDTANKRQGRRFLNHDATTETTRSRYRSRCCIVPSWFLFFCNGERWPKNVVAKRVALSDNALAKKIGDRSLKTWRNGYRLSAIGLCTANVCVRFLADSQVLHAEYGAPRKYASKSMPDAMPQAFSTVVLRRGVLQAMQNSPCAGRRCPGFRKRLQKRKLSCKGILRKSV